MHGLRFVIFTDDHEPAHVHVFGDGEAKIEIGGDGRPPRMIYAAEMKASTQRRARRAVAVNQHFLLAKWAEVHGRVD
ncbi:DUF4160 domain-containing protein [Sphingomonas sp.]|uniref:DUF4160 domain-containing protein n=1 Tax=Sphingomonas sp. TaxID=28214 RepID=UPI00333EE01B